MIELNKTEAKALDLIANKVAEMFPFVDSPSFPELSPESREVLSRVVAANNIAWNLLGRGQEAAVERWGQYSEDLEATYLASSPKDLVEFEKARDMLKAGA